MEHDSARGWWYGRPDWSTTRYLESEALHRFHASETTLQDLRQRSGDAAEVARLRVETTALWQRLSAEEQEHLREMPQYAEFEQLRDG